MTQGLKRLSTHCCPITECRRHEKGFARAWNLQGHMQRVHGRWNTNDVSPISLSASPSEKRLEATGQVRAGALLACEDMQPMDGKTVAPTSLHARLAQLRTQRVELDAKIRKLEDALVVLEDPE